MKPAARRNVDTHGRGRYCNLHAGADAGSGNPQYVSALGGAGRGARRCGVVIKPVKTRSCSTVTESQQSVAPGVANDTGVTEIIHPPPSTRSVRTARIARSITHCLTLPNEFVNFHVAACCLHCNTGSRDPHRGNIDQTMRSQ